MWTWACSEKWSLLSLPSPLQVSLVDVHPCAVSHGHAEQRGEPGGQLAGFHHVSSGWQNKTVVAGTPVWQYKVIRQQTLLNPWHVFGIRGFQGDRLESAQPENFYLGLRQVGNWHLGKMPGMCVVRKSLHKMGTVSCPFTPRGLSFLRESVKTEEDPSKAVLQTGSFKPLNRKKTSVHILVWEGVSVSPSLYSIPPSCLSVAALQLCLPSSASPHRAIPNAM